MHAPGEPDLTIKKCFWLGTGMVAYYTTSWIHTSRKSKILLGKKDFIEIWSFWSKIGGCCILLICIVIFAALPFPHLWLYSDGTNAIGKSFSSRFWNPHSFLKLKINQVIFNFSGSSNIEPKGGHLVVSVLAYDRFYVSPDVQMYKTPMLRFV